MKTHPTPSRYLSGFTLSVLLAATFGGALWAWSCEAPPDLSALRGELQGDPRSISRTVGGSATDRSMEYPSLAIARDPFVTGAKADSIPQSNGN